MQKSRTSSTRKPSGRSRAVLAALAGLLVLGGCQPDVRLMPSPLAFTKQEAPLAPELRLARNAPDVSIFYVTNRQRETGGASAVYTTSRGEHLHFGLAHLRIGDGLSAEDVERLSRTTSSSRRPPVRLLRMEELADLAPREDAAGEGPLAAFFERVEAALARSSTQDLIVYVHGANTPIRRATAHAAQFHHFTGRQAVMLIFVWPSLERVRSYLEDMRQARASGPVFARVLELLAARTRARHIDVLAYSAGAEVASVGMAAVGAPREGESRAEQKARGRLGQVYFAAPDTGTRDFVTNLGQYADLVERVSLSANMSDAALVLAQGKHRESRAGRPDRGELSEEATRFLIEASQRLRMDLIEVDPRVIPGLNTRSHGFWYTSPHVSNDVMAAFIPRYSPQDRALERRETPGGLVYWTFPPDYTQRVTALLQAAPRGGHAPAEPTRLDGAGR